MFEEQLKALELRLHYAWPHTPVNYDSIPYVPERGVAWIRFQATWTASSLICGEYRHGTYRENGVAMIGVFTPRNEGARNNLVLCDEVQQIFRNWSAGHLKCSTSYVAELSQEQEWFHCNVVVPFYYDHNFKAA